MTKDEKKKLKRLNEIFIIKNEARQDIVSQNDYVNQDQYQDSQGNQNMMTQPQPIYLDELSLSKFIEDYLDSQVDLARKELDNIDASVLRQSTNLKDTTLGKFGHNTAVDFKTENQIHQQNTLQGSLNQHIGEAENSLVRNNS
jgi:hypothetical protein